MEVSRFHMYTNSQLSSYMLTSIRRASLDCMTQSRDNRSIIHLENSNYTSPKDLKAP
jgi:hypothetical protein